MPSFEEIKETLLKADSAKLCHLPISILEGFNLTACVDKLQGNNDAMFAANTLHNLVTQGISYNRYLDLIKNDCLYECLLAADIDPGLFALCVYGYIKAYTGDVSCSILNDAFVIWDGVPGTDQSQQVYNMLLAHLIDYVENRYD